MVETIKNSKSLIQLLKTALESYYYKQPIPSEIDDEIMLIMNKISNCETHKIKLIIDGVVDDYAKVLALFAERMASFAVRKKSVEPAKLGLLALLIYAKTEDSREVVLVLSLLYDAIIKVGSDPKKVFDETSSVIGEAELLDNYLGQPDGDKTIDVMGYTESKDENGFLYVRTW